MSVHTESSRILRSLITDWIARYDQGESHNDDKVRRDTLVWVRDRLDEHLPSIEADAVALVGGTTFPDAERLLEANDPAVPA